MDDGSAGGVQEWATRDITSTSQLLVAESKVRLRELREDLEASGIPGWQDMVLDVKREIYTKNKKQEWFYYADGKRYNTHRKAVDGLKARLLGEPKPSCKVPAKRKHRSSTDLSEPSSEDEGDDDGAALEQRPSKEDDKEQEQGRAQETGRHRVPLIQQEAQVVQNSHRLHSSHSPTDTPSEETAHQEPAQHEAVTHAAVDFISEVAYVSPQQLDAAAAAPAADLQQLQPADALAVIDTGMQDVAQQGDEEALQQQPEQTLWPEMLPPFNDLLHSIEARYAQSQQLQHENQALRERVAELEAIAMALQTMAGNRPLQPQVQSDNAGQRAAPGWPVDVNGVRAAGPSGAAEQGVEDGVDEQGDSSEVRQLKSENEQLRSENRRLREELDVVTRAKQKFEKQWQSIMEKLG